MVRRFDREFERHGPPVTRRDFLAHGLWSGSVAALMPSMLPTLLHGQAAQCVKPEFVPGLPIIIIDGAGGMNIPGANVMVGFGPGGQEEFAPGGASSDSDYIRLGLPPALYPTRSGMLDRSMNLVFHSQSALLKGINDGLGANATELKRKMDGTLLCVRTSDDTKNNQINISHMIQRTRTVGRVVGAVGTDQSPSGGNSKSPFDTILATSIPSVVRGAGEAVNLVSMGALGGRSLVDVDSEGGQDRVRQFLERVNNISDAAIRKMRADGINAEMETLLKCANQDVATLMNSFNSSVLDSREDAAVQQVFGNDRGKSTAAISKLVLDSLAGVGTITIGGCDYHNATNATGDRKDEEIGVAIGRCVQLAAAKNKNLMIVLITDGGVTGPASGLQDPTNGKVVWSSDSGTRSAAVQFVFKHDHNPQTDQPLIRPDRRQIGYYNRAGGVNDQSSPIAGSTENLTKLMVLNYLAAMGREGEFGAIFGREAPTELLPLIGVRNLG